MKFNIIPLKYEDYDNILVGWWKDWGWDAPLRDFLPQNGEGGIMVMDGDIPVCAGFIYNTNSKVAWVDWIISNKDYKESRSEAIVLLVETLTSIAKNLDNNYAYALIKHEGLIKTYESLGYMQAENYNTEMIKKL